MDTPAPQPADDSVPAERIRVNDTEREAAIDLIQQAMVDGYVEFGELDERFKLVYSATTRDELTKATDGIPLEASRGPVVGHPSPTNSFLFIGELVKGGWLSVTNRVRCMAFIGSVTIDLSTAEIPPEGVTVDVFQFIGEVTVIVPDGARVQAQGFALIGNRKTNVSRPMTGGPTITVRSYLLIGETKVMSLSRIPEGKLRKLWKQLRT